MTDHTWAQLTPWPTGIADDVRKIRIVPTTIGVNASEPAGKHKADPRRARVSSDPLLLDWLREAGWILICVTSMEYTVVLAPEGQTRPKRYKDIPITRLMPVKEDVHRLAEALHAIGLVTNVVIGELKGCYGPRRVQMSPPTRTAMVTADGVVYGEEPGRAIVKHARFSLAAASGWNLDGRYGGDFGRTWIDADGGSST